MGAVIGWAFLICVVCGCVLGIMHFYSHNKEKREIRREQRTGLTPPNGTTPPEYRIPVKLMHSLEMGISKIVVQNDQIQGAIRRLEDRVGRPDEEF